MSKKKSKKHQGLGSSFNTPKGILDAVLMTSGKPKRHKKTALKVAQGKKKPGVPQPAHKRGTALNRKRAVRLWAAGDDAYVKVDASDVQVCSAGHEWRRTEFDRTCPYCYKAMTMGVDPREIVVPKLSGGGDLIGVQSTITVSEAKAVSAADPKRGTPSERRIEAPDRYDLTPREKLVIRVERPDAPAEATATKLTGKSATKPEPKKPDPVERMHRNAVAAHLRSGKTIRVTCKDKALDMQALRGEITRLLERQGERCARTGVEFDHDDHWLLASLDRIDSSKGYVPGNLQVVTWFYNRLKGTMDEEEFLELAYLHFGGRR